MCAHILSAILLHCSLAARPFECLFFPLVCVCCPLYGHQAEVLVSRRPSFSFRLVSARQGGNRHSVVETIHSIFPFPPAGMAKCVLGVWPLQPEWCFRVAGLC
ncbi:unnamed protein product [Protopolystoma xenopodis]|uniref:Secreted protein n=1 Tax=Protopolystoma xenopodis TaxID=117903 RepID=A0A448XA41_9PLAT|nr:unnamed protein product [Protopolystoma xenopodis]